MVAVENLTNLETRNIRLCDLVKIKRNFVSLFWTNAFVFVEVYFLGLYIGVKFYYKALMAFAAVLFVQKHFIKSKVFKSFSSKKIQSYTV